MFRITNIEEINEKYSRQLGNEVIIKVSEFVKSNVSKDYLFIRYMGPKFVIVFSGVDTESVENFIGDIKAEIEKTPISITENENIDEIEIEDGVKKVKKKKEKTPPSAIPKLNFVLTTYYKGTGMEEVLKKLEQYIDSADKNESEITCI